MKLKYLPFYFFFLAIAFGCATYAPQYKELKSVHSYPSDKTVEKTFYLVGDAGNSVVGGMSIGLQIFQKYLEGKETVGDYTLFLGDNIYPVGMPSENEPDRGQAAYRLDAQIAAAANFEGTIHFIPGNHDWYNGGLHALKRQEDYLEEKLVETTALQPDNGCPLKSVTVSENVQLIMIDSQWYLEDWNVHPTMNEFCEIKTREKFFIELSLELEKHKNKTIVFAMHHPMFTNGTHGGYFGAQKHLYPTQKKIPLPGLASLVTQIRAQGGVSVQDRYNELYNKFMNKLAAVGKKHGKLIFASGHEHTLQHVEKDGLVQILSGSGSKGGFAALGSHGLFSYGGQGFAVLDIFTDGSSYVRYYGTDSTMEPILLFEKEIFPKKEQYNLGAFDEVLPETIKTAIYNAPDSIQVAPFFKTIWGSKYKSVYTTPISAKVANLDSMYGGLRVVRDNNTDDYKSLLLEDTYGNLFNMRALKKQALRFNEGGTNDQKNNPESPVAEGEENSDFSVPDTYGSEFYTASHPYALLALPELADSIQLFDNRPILTYVPKQKALKEYNSSFGDELYYISVAPSENNEGDRIFRYARDIETTDDILLKVRKGGNVKIDEQVYIKSRLFDMLVGDWDREPDHWRWALYYTKGNDSVYVPIARNRDDAFASLDGDILDVARSILGSSNQRHLYTESLTDLPWFNEEGIILDRALLQKATEKQWQFIAKQITEALTDEVIDTAFSKLPEETQDESLEEIVNTLKARRDNLTAIAEEYFRYYNKLRTLEGTDSANYFEIERAADGVTIVREYGYTEGEKGTLEKEVTFYRNQTKQLWIYGLDGNDVFEVTGSAQENMLVRIIGGHGNDIYEIKNGKNIRIYDHLSKQNTVTQKDGALVRFTDLYTLNTFDYRKQISTNNNFVASAGYNPDDGGRLGLQYTHQLNGFSRNPFSRQHKLNAGYYFDTSSFDVGYQGEIANLYKTFNLSFGARVTSANFIHNYFGYGNETKNFQDALGFDANRVEVQTLSGNVGLVRNSFFGSFYKIQFRTDAISLNSAITGAENPTNSAVLDETIVYGTLEGIYSYRSFDNARNPSRGMLFDLTAGVTDNFEDVERLYGFLSTRMGFYNSLESSNKLVLKTNVQGQFNFGNTFDFYQGVQIGGSNGLRGYRNRRFTGKSSLVGNADIRYSFNEFKVELFPLQIGIYGGADIGRVWTPSENSEKWHNSYGGGLWVNGRGGFNASASLFHSTEDTRLVFGLGFGF